MRHGLSETCRHGLSETRNTAYRKPNHRATRWIASRKRIPSNGANMESFGFLLTCDALCDDGSVHERPSGGTSGSGRAA